MNKLTGGSSDYYKVFISYPTSEGITFSEYGHEFVQEPYMAECNDIIEALEMNYAEGNVFKALWRRAAKRLGNGKEGTSAIYDAEKMVFFSDRILKQEMKGEQ